MARCGLWRKTRKPSQPWRTPQLHHSYDLCYDEPETCAYLSRSCRVLFGPVFTREVVIAPRRKYIYIARTAYVASLLVLMSTAWLVLTGTQLVRDVGDMARFGAIVFQILVPLQLALAVFFSATLAASAVAREKDRRTLLLLLLTSLSNGELVLGKLLASLLQMLVMLAAGLPLFLLATLLGGVSFSQIGRAVAVTTASMLVCGSLGSTLALWREKTFQAIAMTVLILVLWLVTGGIGGRRSFGSYAGRHPCHDLGHRREPLASDPRSHPPLHAGRACAGTSRHAGLPFSLHVCGNRRRARRFGRGDGPQLEFVSGRRPPPGCEEEPPQPSLGIRDAQHCKTPAAPGRNEETLQSANLPNAPVTSAPAGRPDPVRMG